MSYNQDDQGFFHPEQTYSDNQSSGYDIPVTGDPGQFQEPQFGQFDYAQTGGSYGGEQYGASQPAGNQYIGSILTPDPVSGFGGPEAEDFENEPPLMEELGINFDHIKQKTVVVLNPFTSLDTSVMQDTDLAGPLVFCLAFGGSLLLSGKVHFGYIYGIGLVGCLAMYALLNLMSMTGVSTTCVISCLGYCLLPMCILSFSSIVLSLQGLIGILLTAVTVLWCSVSASKLFVTALAMDQQQLLVAYPCALVYGVFALLTVF